jgi:hypothetical protein
MVKALKLQEFLEPHREVSIPHGAYVSTRLVKVPIWILSFC